MSSGADTCHQCHVAPREVTACGTACLSLTWTFLCEYVVCTLTHVWECSACSVLHASVGYVYVIEIHSRTDTWIRLYPGDLLGLHPTGAELEIKCVRR